MILNSVPLAASVLAALLHLTAAQTPAAIPEVRPLLPTWKCTTSGGCVQQNTSVVLDWEYRNIHTTGGTTSCKSSVTKLSTSLCPDAATCARNCVVEPADYAATGVSTSGNALTMYHYVRVNGRLVSASPRVYLLGADGKYVLMNLLNQELTVDVDLSTLPCGENGAFYLSEMTADGTKNPNQPFNVNGASMGNGYCDAQCQGYCCPEMDIIEANSQANVYTGHPCRGDNCDKGGCGYNPYASGQRNFWGPGKTVDTSKPFTVVTQFPASGGRLTQMTRKYIQNGRTINSPGAITGCGSEASTGGLVGMGQTLGRGSKSFSVALFFLPCVVGKGEMLTSIQWCLP